MKKIFVFLAVQILAIPTFKQAGTALAVVALETTSANQVIYLPLAMRHLGVTEQVSVASDGTQGNDYSYFPSISGDGRYVAFGSVATNLVEGDTNGESDVFVHDRQTGITELVSVSSDGTQGNGESNTPSISADGRYVAFTSAASNLVSGDTNDFCWSGGDANCDDIFVHDRETGVTQRVSVASDGTQGDFASIGASISVDGRYVAFYSWATNLVDWDTQQCEPGPLVAQEQNCADVFVHDRQTGVTERVSVSSDGTQGDGDSYDPSISADGRYVAFWSIATNLVNGDTQQCEPGPLSAQGQTCADIFVHDRQTGVTELVSVASNGTQANDSSSDPSISGDGRYVAFESAATNLVEGDTNGEGDIFVHDRQMGVTERVSVASDGTQGSGWSPSISNDGRYVSFMSLDANLVAGDTNELQDVFLHDRETGDTGRVSVGGRGMQGNDHCIENSISGDGRYVVFSSYATNLVYGESNDYEDVFVRWWNGQR